MLEMVGARRNADKVEERYDLFSGLLDAAQDEPGSEAALSDEELMGASRSFGILEMCLTPLRKHVYLPSCRTRGGTFPFF
jgi:hypothetical protein